MRRFRPGLDYTVGSYDTLAHEGELSTLDVCFTLVDEGQLDDAKFVWKVAPAPAATSATGAAATASSSSSAAAAAAGAGAASAPRRESPWEPYRGSIRDGVDAVVDDDDEEEEEDEEEDGASDVAESSGGAGKGVFAAENAMIKAKRYRSKSHMWRSDDFGGFNVSISHRVDDRSVF